VSEINQLQEWYLAHCNGRWEHDHGITIESLDNPGWRVRIDLRGSELESKRFVPVEEGSKPGNVFEDHWISCKVEDQVFWGAGKDLGRILKRFLDWAVSSV
jgi:hypothetical protein